MALASVAGKSKQSKSDPNRGDGPLATAPSDPNSSPAPLSRYESQKRLDWKNFLEYLGKQKPPITPAGCRDNHVTEFLCYLNQLGKIMVHRTVCPFFGNPESPDPCTCPLRPSTGSLEALIGRLTSAYVEDGGLPESNPFTARAVWDYLREVRPLRAKARGNTTGTGSDGDGIGSHASRASLSSTSANDQAQPSNNNMVRNPKATSRASRRAPTTVLTTDTTNFRAIDQEFTGIPAPPFISSPFPKSRIDRFGTSSSLRSSSSRDSPKLLKHQDWGTFLRYLGNQKPPITIAECSENHVLGLLKYLDQFGQVKVHNPWCLLLGHPNPVAACACPLWPASGSLDVFIERLRSAYVEHGGRPESNPFAARAVRNYLREVRESQAKARGNTTGTGSDGDGSGSAAQTTFTLPTRRKESIVKASERRRQHLHHGQSEPTILEAGLTRKGIALGIMENLSKDNEPVTDTFQKALPMHHNPDTLKKLNDAEKAKRELQQQEYLDIKLAIKEHEKESPESNPFAGRAARVYLREVRECQDKARGIPYKKKKGKCPTTVTDKAVVASKGQGGNTTGTGTGSDGDGSGSAAQTTSTTTTRKKPIIQANERRLQHLHQSQSGLTVVAAGFQSLHQSQSDPTMLAAGLTSKGIAVDNEPVIDTFQKALPEHHNPDTLMKLNDAEIAKRELEQQEYFDTKLANEEHEKGTGYWRAFYTEDEEAIKPYEEKSEDEVASEPLGMVIDVKEVKMTNSSGQHGLFLMRGGLGLTKPPKDEDWKNAKEIYLMDNELSDLPENPRCPNLSALFLPRNYKLRMIPQSFFNFMPALQILNLSRTGIKSLPDSLIRLESLKRLFLNGCHRLMILSSKVGDLKQLEVLDLEGANIMDFPKEIKNLTNLTCLEISFYGFTSNGRRTMQSNAVVPCGVISALSQLEELNIDVNPDDERWNACVEDIVNEVCTLKRLETLKFYFPRVELLGHFLWNSLLLPNFRFTVGHHVKRILSRVPPDAEFELERWERCLKYINGVGVHRDIKNVLQHVTAFFLDRHATIKKLSDFETRNMKQLKCCVVGECNELQVIIDAADAYGEDGISEIVSESYDDERIVLGSLEHLYIYYMKSLRSIWEGPVQQNSLFLLKSLTLSTCPQLTTIFTKGLLDNLCNLGELKVEYCYSIKAL